MKRRPLVIVDGIKRELSDTDELDVKIQIIQSLSFGSPLTPATLSVNTNNYVVTDLDKTVILRISASSNVNITGLVPADITKTQMLLVTNISTKQITIVNNSGLSLSQNRFLTGTSKNLQLDESILLFYDTVSQRWRSGGIII